MIEEEQPDWFNPKAKGKKKKKSSWKKALPLVLVAVGIAMLFFKQTGIMGPFFIGYGMVNLW